VSAALTLRAYLKMWRQPSWLPVKVASCRQFPGRTRGWKLLLPAGWEARLHIFIQIRNLGRRPVLRSTAEGGHAVPPQIDFHS